MIIFKSIITKNLTNKNIHDICTLKETHWKFGLNSQLNFFKKNIRSSDIHNCCFLKKKLIGYTLLKNRSFKIKNVKINFIHFDTLILDKNFRNKKIGNKLMTFNNDKIIAQKLPAFLICNNDIKNFYIKNLWKKADKKFNGIDIYKLDLNLLIFNQNLQTNK